MTSFSIRALLASLSVAVLLGLGLAHASCGELIVPARAEANGMLSEQAVLGALAARGYREMAAIERRGGTYVLAARNARGFKVRLALDARTGEIVGLKPLPEPRRR